MEIYCKLICANWIVHDPILREYFIVPCHKNFETEIKKVSYDDVHDFTVELYKFNYKLGDDNQINR